LASAFMTLTIDLRFSFEAQSATQCASVGPVPLVEQIPVPEPGTGMLTITGPILLSGHRHRDVGREYGGALANSSSRRPYHPIPASMGTEI